MSALTRFRPLPEILIAAGRNSLSIYVLQGMLAGMHLAGGMAGVGTAVRHGHMSH